MNLCILNYNSFGAMLKTCGYDYNIYEKSIINDKISIYLFLKQLNIKPNEQTMEIAIKYGDYEMFYDSINNIENYDPTNIDIQKVLNSVNININILSKLFLYRITPTKEDLNVLIKNTSLNKYIVNISTITEIIELMIKYGLILTLDDINNLLGINIVVKNLSRFNIEYDEKLYYYCYINNIYPYDDEYVTAARVRLALPVLVRVSVCAALVVLKS